MDAFFTSQTRQTQSFFTAFIVDFGLFWPEACHEICCCLSELLGVCGVVQNFSLVLLLLFLFFFSILLNPCDIVTAANLFFLSRFCHCFCVCLPPFCALWTQPVTADGRPHWAYFCWSFFFSPRWAGGCIFNVTSCMFSLGLYWNIFNAICLFFN